MMTSCLAASALAGAAHGAAAPGLPLEPLTDSTGQGLGDTADDGSGQNPDILGEIIRATVSLSAGQQPCEPQPGLCW